MIKKKRHLNLLVTFTSGTVCQCDKKQPFSDAENYE